MKYEYQKNWMLNLRKMIGYEKKTNIDFESLNRVVEIVESNKSSTIRCQKTRHKKSGKSYVKFDLVGKKNSKNEGRVSSITYRDGYIRQESNFLEVNGKRCSFNRSGFLNEVYGEHENIPKIPFSTLIFFLKKWKGWCHWEVKNLRTNIEHKDLM